MKEFFHRHKWKLLGAFAFFLIVVPALINLAFKLHAPCGFLAAEWSAGDVLSFYGAMLASVATIMGVYLSIDYAQRNYREDEANRVRPYLALTHYKSKSRSNLLSLVFRPQTMNRIEVRMSFMKNINLIKCLSLLAQMVSASRIV